MIGFAIDLLKDFIKCEKNFAIGDWSIYLNVICI